MFGVAALRLIPSANRISGAVISVRYGSFAMNELYRDVNETQNINLDSVIIADKNARKLTKNIIKDLSL